MSSLKEKLITEFHKVKESLLNMGIFIKVTGKREKGLDLEERLLGMDKLLKATGEMIIRSVNK